MFNINVLVVIILLIGNYYFLECESSRIYFSKCGFGGFSCASNNGKYKITYQCPTNENDATFYLWQFRAPLNTESLIIRNCTTLRLSFQCFRDNRAITYFALMNITNLFIINTEYTHNPHTVVLENIEKLENIPENTFSQIKRKPIPTCINPAKDLQNLHFNKVNIGIIAPKAFSGLKEFSNFSWNEVNVKRLQHLAIQVEFEKDGNFSIRKSGVEVIEHVGLKIVGSKAEFVENKFVDLFSGSINGTIETFVFSANSVSNLQPYGISVLSEKVYISDNRFEYLRSGAFEKISPGLLQNSQRSFGTLKFIYDFHHNFVNFMDAASLNPDMQAYENVATELIFHHNLLFCSCQNLAWLFSNIGYGYNTALVQDFYETITQEEYKNSCAYTSCDLPLQSAKRLTEDGKCKTNAENLCSVEAKNETTTEKEFFLPSRGPISYCMANFVLFALVILAL